MTTAAYDTAAAAFSKRVQWLVEIDYPECSLNYTTAPCTAVDQGDGMRCFNTFSTCQDLTNYTPTTRPNHRRLRFCLNDVPWYDSDTPTWPYLLRPVFTPQRIETSRLMTFPETINLDMLPDWTVPALNRNKTLFNTASNGEFWRNLKARYPNYSRLRVRIKRGFADPAVVLNDFAQVGPVYRLVNIDVGPDVVRITARSPLADLDKRQVPFPISNDNTIQDAGGITNIATSVTVRDGAEYPNPTDYARNTIYARMESEIVEVTAVTGNVLTISRAKLGTANVSHAAGIKVEHVAAFGTNVTAASATDTLQDLLEWAGVEAADVDTASFDAVEEETWAGLDIYRIVVKSESVSKMLGSLRDQRGIIVYLNSAGEWACSVMAPNATPTMIGEDQIVENSCEVVESEAERITRVGLWYDPAGDNPGTSPDDFDKSVYVIDSELESVNYYDGVSERLLFDPWLDPNIEVARVRNIASRYVARNRRGVRTIVFSLEVAEAGLDVGDSVGLTTRHVLDRDGNQEARPCIIVAKQEMTPGITQYEAIDVNYSGRYLRIGPDTLTDDYDTATTEERAYGYWGDANNRVGAVKELGYVLW